MIDIHMFYVNVDTARFTTNCGFQEDAPKPVLVHTELITFDIAFRHENGTPFDLTGASLTAAWDNNFIHTDSLAASTSDVDIIDAEGGIARFHVQCSSEKFAQLVYSRPTTVKMQVVYYSLEDLGGNSILRDCGVTLCPRVATTEGMPEQDDPDYYNKVQVDALLETKVGVAEDMPEASAEYLGSVVVYSGTAGEYETGHSYKCIQSSDQYMWQDITPAGESSKDSVIHSDELPEASEDVLGDVYLYTGNMAPYEYGQKYICVQTNLGYIWSRMTERVNSVNNKTGDVVLNATDVGAIASPVGGNSGEYLKKTSEGAVWSEISNNWPVVQLSTESFTPKSATIYEYTVQDGDEITFGTPTGSGAVVFEYRITVPDPVPAFTFRNTLTWLMNSASLVATPGTHRLKITYIPPVDESNSGSGEPTGTWEVYLPDLSQYALAADYVPKTGGTFTGRIYSGDRVYPSNQVSIRNYNIIFEYGGIAVKGLSFGIISSPDIYSQGTMFSNGCYGNIAMFNSSLSLPYPYYIKQCLFMGDHITFGGNGGHNALIGDGVSLSAGVSNTSCWGTYNATTSNIYRVVGCGTSNSDRRDAEVLDQEGNHLIAGAHINAGSKETALTSLAEIQPRQGVVYTYTLSGGEAITLGTPTTGYCPTIELWITQPSTAVSFLLGTTVLWNDGSGNFSSGNQAPAMDTGNRTYCMVFRWTGSVWLCNLAYTVEVSE